MLFEKKAVLLCALLKTLNIMKKLLFFAFTLVASVMAFTSCDKKDNVNPLVGTWKASVDREWSVIHYTLVVDETNYSFTDQNNVDTKIEKGTYELNEKEGTGVLHQKTVTFISEVQNETFPSEEDIRFKYVIKDKSLTITIGLDWERPQELTLNKE